MKAMQSQLRFTAVGITILLVAIGCAGGGGPLNPVVPPDSGNMLTDSAQLAGSPHANHWLWGYWLVSIDQETLSAEVIPIRAAAGHWNVLQFLEKWPCTNCFKVESVWPDPGGTLNVSVSVRHPFANANLTGFDVRGIAMFNGSHQFPASALTMSDRTMGEGEIVNAAGYTTLFNPTTIGHGLQGYIKGKLATLTAPSSTLNGFRRFVTNDAANTRNAFYAGDEIAVTYKVDMHDPPNPWVFGYAVDACWMPPISKPVDDPMTDFGLDANCPEAWKILISHAPIGGGLTDCGGQAMLTIDVYDWQGKDDAHPVVVECPELFDGVVEATWKQDGVGYTRYEAVVENVKNAPAGVYRCLVSNEAAENDPSKPWLDITAYQLHELEVVAETMQPPTAVAEAGQPSAHVGEAISFDASGSHDNDCGDQSIVKYEWDWENDGTYDEEGVQADHSWSTEGAYYVQLRVTDDEAETDTLDDPLELTILPTVPPVAVATADPLTQYSDMPIHFSDNGSYDPDGGSIVNYEWDWDNDGTFDEEGTEADHSWSAEGTYYVQFRVTDDEAQTDTLDDPLELTILPRVPPVAIASADPLIQMVDQPIHFSDNGSYDPDGGPIVNWEWDWDNDGTFDEEGTEADHSWPAEGTYYVQFRVTDDEADTDTLDEPLEVTVVTTLPPVAVATADPLTQIVNLPIHFSDDGSYDPDGGSITKYEWDWDDDGTFDEEGVEADHSWSVEGTYYVQFRVTDDEAETGTLDEPLEVTIVPTLPPIAVATADPLTQIVNLPIHFSDDGSYDPDGGSITKYEWDWDNDGTLDEEGIEADHSWSAEGTYYIQFRVTDDEAETGTLDEPLEVTIEPAPIEGWARTWGGSDWDNGKGVAVDGSGNAYVAGYFMGTVDFDPGPGVANRASAGSSDIFISKFDSAGSFLWVVTWGGSESDGGTAVAVDSSGYVYVTGGFMGTVDFDPGVGVDERSSAGDYDVFLSKFDSSGGVIWAKTWGGVGRDESTGVAVDGFGDAYVSGFFFGTADFDPDIGEDWHTSSGEEDIFLSKISSSGTFAWAKTWGASSSDSGNGVATDLSGNVYLTGGFRLVVDFDPGAGVDSHASNGWQDVFLCKLDSSGAFLWAKSWGGFYPDRGYGVAADNTGNVYVTGGYCLTVDFDPGAGEDSHVANGESDVFLSKFDSSGSFVWAKTWGGANLDGGLGVAVDGSGNVYVTGSFMGGLDFDPGPGEDWRDANGFEDVFLSKFGPSGAFLWVNTWGGSGHEGLGRVTVALSADAYVAGYFNETVNFDPGVGVDNHTSNGQDDAFLVKFLPDGSW